MKETLATALHTYGFRGLATIYSKNPHKRTRFLGFRLILFLYIGCFLQNQPENVLKVFVKLFLKI